MLSTHPRPPPQARAAADKHPRPPLVLPSLSYAKRQHFYLDTIVVIYSCDADNLFKLWLKSLHCESNVPADLGLDLSLKTAVRTPSHHPHHRILLLRICYAVHLRNKGKYCLVLTLNALCLSSMEATPIHARPMHKASTYRTCVTQ